MCAFWLTCADADFLRQMGIEAEPSIRSLAIDSKSVVVARPSARTFGDPVVSVFWEHSTPDREQIRILQDWLWFNDTSLTEEQRQLRVEEAEFGPGGFAAFEAAEEAREMEAAEYLNDDDEYAGWW